MFYGLVSYITQQCVICFMDIACEQMIMCKYCDIAVEWKKNDSFISKIHDTFIKYACETLEMCKYI